MKESYSQNNEDIRIAEYFNGYVGTLLDIGANDGMTLSNSFGFIRDGWEASLVEPAAEAFNKLQQLHSFNDKVFCYNAAISNFCGQAELLVSDEHLGKGDTGLLSTLIEKETQRWRGTQNFKPVKVEIIDFEKLLEISPYEEFDLISIDAEGSDLIILEQMDMEALQCKCIVVEWNLDKEILAKIKSHCGLYGFTNELLINAENIVLTR